MKALALCFLAIAGCAAENIVPAWRVEPAGISALGEVLIVGTGLPDGKAVPIVDIAGRRANLFTDAAVTVERADGMMSVAIRLRADAAGYLFPAPGKVPIAIGGFGVPAALSVDVAVSAEAEVDALLLDRAVVLAPYAEALEDPVLDQLRTIVARTRLPERRSYYADVVLSEELRRLRRSRITSRADVEARDRSLVALAPRLRETLGANASAGGWAPWHLRLELGVLDALGGEASPTSLREAAACGIPGIAGRATAVLREIETARNKRR